MWSLSGSDRLSPRALAAIEAAAVVLVSPITFFEIAQKVRLGKWPEMTPCVGELPALLRSQGGGVADFDPAICLEAGLLDWPHRDPFDRLIAATARRAAIPVISADAVFDGIVSRMW